MPAAPKPAAPGSADLTRPCRSAISRPISGCAPLLITFCAPFPRRDEPVRRVIDGRNGPSTEPTLCGLPSSAPAISA
jgi:hypothetical protein